MKKLLLLISLCCLPCYAVQICEPLEDSCAYIPDNKIQYIEAILDGQYILKVHADKLYTFYYGRYEVLLNEDFQSIMSSLIKDRKTTLTPQQYMNKYYKIKR